jgi:hypothetical protein
VYTVGAFIGGTLAVFDRDQGTGRLTFVEREAAESGAAIAVSPEDGSLYVGGFHRLLVFDVGCAALTTKPRLKLARVDPDLEFADDVLVLKGEGALRRDAFQQFDPVTTGVAVAVLDPDDTVVRSMSLPGGVFAGGGTVGWKLNKRGDRWLYLDKRAEPVNGIRKVGIQLREGKGADVVKVRVIGKKGDYPVSAASATRAVAVDLVGPSECVEARFHASTCRFKGTTHVCTK